VTLANGSVQVNSTALAFREYAEDLAAWALERFVNRRDVWGGYTARERRGATYVDRHGGTRKVGTTYTKPSVDKRGKVFLTSAVLVKHFCGARVQDICGLHPIADDNTSRWGSIDIDVHGDGGHVDPKLTFLAIKAWYDVLCAAGFRPLLWDSNGKGGYHLDVIFATPVATKTVFGFLKWLTRDYASHGLAAAPEIFPKQEAIGNGKRPYGNWARIIGRHHTSDHWASAWNGAEFLSGEPLVDFLLSLHGDDPSLIPIEAIGSTFPSKPSDPADNKPRDGTVDPVDRKLALSALAGLNKERCEDYDSWVHVGMALHSVAEDDEMLDAWTDWSRQSDKHQNGDCIAKWSSFNRDRSGGITLGSLVHWAEEDGWKRPQGPKVTFGHRKLTNFRSEPKEVTNKKGEVKKSIIRIGLAAPDIARRLFDITGGWPKRVGKMLFTKGADGKPLWLEGADDLFGWICSQLPGGDCGLEWVNGGNRISQGVFAAYLRQACDAYDAVEAFPHWPPLPNTYYMHPALEGGDGKALKEYLKRFKPATNVDNDLLLAFHLSLVWGGSAGQRPGWLFTAEDNDTHGGRGVGKSAVIKLAARIFSGHIDASSTEPIKDLVTRILSPDGLDKRIVLFDNVKTLRFSCAELEAIITNDIISGHRMYSGEGRRPNTLTFCLTLNGASLSRDMAQRSIIVQMGRPPHNADWEMDAIEFIEANRWAIIGDLIAELQVKAASLARHSRWGTWENDVLTKVDEPKECQKAIEERQGQVDEDAAEADIVRQGFIAELRARGHDAENQAVWIASATVAAIVNVATNERRPVNKATAYLRTLTIEELRENRLGTGRGWLWTGKNAGATDKVDLKEVPFTRGAAT
jgi:hypothetical protein